MRDRESILTLVPGSPRGFFCVLFLVSAAACAGTRPVSVSPSGPTGEQVFLTLGCGGYRERHLAVGDTARLTAAVASQMHDVVKCPSQSLVWPQWRTTAPEILTIDSTGTVRAINPGRAMVQVKGIGGEAHKEFTIIPPVEQYYFVPGDTTVSIGDTVRVFAVARNRAGALVAQLSASGLSHGDSGRVIDVIEWADTMLILQAVAPGIARAFGRLGDRMDSAVIRVAAPSGRRE